MRCLYYILCTNRNHRIAVVHEYVREGISMTVRIAFSQDKICDNGRKICTLCIHVWNATRFEEKTIISKLVSNRRYSR